MMTARNDPASCRFSVIIAARQEEAAIADAIRSARDAGAAEIIVVDGQSTDRTTAISRDLGCLTLESSPGRGRQLNLGASHATRDILLFLHADSRLPADALQQIEAALGSASPDTFCWGGFRQSIDHPGLAYRLLERGNALRVRWRHRVYGDQAMWMRRPALEKIGGVPEIPLMEDVVLSKRLCRLSKPLLLKGPVTTSARRWKQNGIVRQTLRNQLLLTLFRLGVSPERLARWYQ